MSEKYNDTFCIEFDTKEMPGNLVATQVTLKKRIMRKQDTAFVNLCDHPLYSKLADYVFSNPPKGFKIRRSTGEH